MTDTIDWQALLFNPDAGLADQLQALARRRFGDTADAESAYNYALDSVSANDWQRLRDGYASRGSPAGFMKTAFVRLLEDYAIAKYGKKRPPKWLQRLGPVWKRIYELLCLKRLPRETIVDHICAQTSEQPDTVRMAMSTIKARVPGCGQYIGEYTDNDGSPAADTLQNDSEAPIEQLEQSELATILSVLASLLQDTDTAEHGAGDNRCDMLAASMAGRLDSLRASLAIEPRERLLLRLIYHEGASMARASRALKTPEHTLRRRHQALIARVSRVLQQFGIDAQVLRTINETRTT